MSHATPAPEDGTTPLTDPATETPLAEGDETLEQIDGGWSLSPKIEREDYWALKQQQQAS